MAAHLLLLLGFRVVDARDLRGVVFLAFRHDQGVDKHDGESGVRNVQCFVKALFLFSGRKAQLACAWVRARLYS